MDAAAHFTISSEQRKSFAGTFLLSHMLKEKVTYDVLLLSDDKHLEPTLTWLLMKGLIELNTKHHYVLSTRGRERALAFALRYQTLLTYFDLFAAVDLESGEFAFAEFSDFSSTSAWQRHLAHDRWDDLRIPIIERLGGSAIELVFCQFVQENRIVENHSFWAIELATGGIWQEITSICDSAFRADQLGYQEPNGDPISGDTVLDDIAEQGLLLLRELHPSDPDIHSNLQAWYPRHDHHNPDLPRPLPGWETPIWQTLWSLDA